VENGDDLGGRFKFCEEGAEGREGVEAHDAICDVGVAEGFNARGGVCGAKRGCRWGVRKHNEGGDAAGVARRDEIMMQDAARRKSHIKNT
jgi:hypothetical protein